MIVLTLATSKLFVLINSLVLDYIIKPLDDKLMITQCAHQDRAVVSLNMANDRFDPSHELFVLINSLVLDYSWGAGRYKLKHPKEIHNSLSRAWLDSGTD